MTIVLKPQRFIWSTDVDFPAGAHAWSAQPCKVAPASGRRQSGYEPTIRAAAENYNYLLNEIGMELDTALAKYMIKNWSEHQGVASGLGVPSRAVTATDSDAVFVIGAGGRLHISKYIDGRVGNAGNRLVFSSDPALDLSWAAGPGNADIALKDIYTSIQSLAVFDTAVDQVGYLSAMGGAWAASITFLTGTYTWRACCYNIDWGWVIAGSGGGIAHSNNPTVGWAEQVPVYSSEIMVVKSNNLTGLNHRFLAATDNAEFLYSSDGTSWTGVDTGHAELIYDLAYSDAENRWIGVSESGRTYISDDDGVTWARSAVLEEFSDYGSVADTICISSNGRNSFLIVASAAGDTKAWYSVDCGNDFRRLKFDDYPAKYVTCYGGSRFIMFGDDDGIVSLAEDW